MIKSYRLKLYPNKGKEKELNRLFAFWRDQVNHKIKIFWGFDEVRSSTPPKENRRGGRLISDTSVRAWNIVKGARKTEQKGRPHFKGKEVDLNQFSGYIINGFTTEGFDIWFNVICLNKGKRLKIPSKRTLIFNEAIESGNLRKTFKILKRKGGYYIECFVDLPEVRKENHKFIGIDVGINNALATSDGSIFGKEIKELRIRTRWRNYKRKMTPSKQSLNRHANKIVESYPDTDFVVEDLLFKGKRKSNRQFRRRHNNWAYNHLAKKLSEIGHLEGFQVIKVDPAYSSQTCPMCEFIDGANRRGEKFLCGQCGYKGNADIVGAMNLIGRVARESSVPLNRVKVVQ